MHEHEHPEPELQVEERSVGGTIGAFAAGVGLGYATDLGKIAAQETVEKIKDVFTSDEKESPIILPPGVGDDE